MRKNTKLIAIPFGPGGVDTRTDSKAIAPPKLSVLEHGVFTTPRTVRKRFGYSEIASQAIIDLSIASADGDLAGCRSLAVIDGELLINDDLRLHRYAAGRWQYNFLGSGFGWDALSPGWQLEYQTFAPAESFDHAASAQSTELHVLAWKESTPTHLVSFEVRDAATGALLRQGSYIGDEFSKPQLVAIGADVFMFFADAANNEILGVRFRRDGAAVDISNPVETIVSDLSGTNGIFDIRAAGSQILLVYVADGGATINHGYVSTDLVAGSMASELTGPGTEIVVPSGGWDVTFSAAVPGIGTPDWEETFNLPEGTYTLAEACAAVQAWLNTVVSPLAGGIAWVFKVLDSGDYYATHGTDQDAEAQPHHGKVAVWNFAPGDGGHPGNPTDPPSTPYVNFGIAWVDTDFRDALGFLADSSYLSGGHSHVIATLTEQSSVSALGCAVEATSLNYAVFWGVNDTVTARMFNAAKTALFAATDIGTLGAAEELTITGAIRAPVGDEELWVYFTRFPDDAVPFIEYATIKADGGGAEQGDFMQRSMLASHAWVHGGDVYMAVHNYSASLAQRNAFIVRGASGYAFDDDGRSTGALVAGGIFPASHAYPGREQFDTFGYEQWSHGLPHVTTIGATQYQFPLMGAADGSGRSAVKVVDVFTSRPLTWVQHGRGLYAPGGFLAQYDGRMVSEVGFFTYPEIEDDGVGAGGNLTANGVYSYRVYYEWINGRGERERSSAVPYTVTAGATDKTVTLTISTLVHTAKRSIYGSGVSIVVYRTIANDVSTYYRVSNPNPETAGDTNGYVKNDEDEPTVEFVDAMSDALASDNEPDYLSDGELDHIAPAPSTVICTGNGRIFLAGFDDPNLVRYSKTRETGEPAAFNEALAIFIDAGEGPITGLTMMGDALVVFREGQTFVLGGDGYDNTGFGSTLTPPQVISDSIGCISQRSIVETQAGIMFQSQKGIYLLSGEGMSYIGADVESYNDQAVLAAVAMPDRHEVRLTMSGGDTLVYDIAAGQWAAWPDVTALDAVIWRGQYVRLVDDTGLTVGEVEDQFHDDGAGYPMRVRTPWINLGAMQGFQRVFEANVLGEFRSSHVIRTRVFYDYKTTHDDEFTWDASDVIAEDADAIYQFEIPLRIQKCEAVMFEFVDIAAEGDPDAIIVPEGGWDMLVYSDSTAVTITVPAGTYTRDELAAAVATAINDGTIPSFGSSQVIGKVLEADDYYATNGTDDAGGAQPHTGKVALWNYNPEGFPNTGENGTTPSAPAEMNIEWTDPDLGAALGFAGDLTTGATYYIAAGDGTETVLRESYRLSELLLEVGLKRGPWKDAANRRGT